MNVFEAAKAAIPMRKAAECYEQQNYVEKQEKEEKEENGYYQEDKIA